MAEFKSQELQQDYSKGISGLICILTTQPHGFSNSFGCNPRVVTVKPIRNHTTWHEESLGT